MDLQPRSEEIAPVSDRSWLASPPQSDATRDTLGVTLIGDLFPAGQFPGGLVPAGTLVGRIGTTRQAGPHSTGAEDGRDTAAGFTLTDAVVSPGRRSTVALVDRGRVFVGRLPNPAAVTAEAAADLPQVSFEPPFPPVEDDEEGED